MQPGREILHKWEAQLRRLHPRMEITRDGLVLGAGTILAKVGRDNCGSSTLMYDEPHALALLTTAYERPVGPHALAKIGRACELWNEGEKALAHIHLAHAGLPVCGEAEALRLFVAAEVLENDVSPDTLLKAQGFEVAAPRLSKWPGQPRDSEGER